MPLAARPRRRLLRAHDVGQDLTVTEGRETRDHATRETSEDHTISEQTTGDHTDKDQTTVHIRDQACKRQSAKHGSLKSASVAARRLVEVLPTERGATRGPLAAGE